MRFLAIDTSTWWGGAALVETAPDGPRLVAEIGLHVEDSHAAHALALVEAVLATAGWDKTSLDAYVAVRGPGSFTGIRVAMGLARGLGLAAGRPCIGIGTLDAMAEAFGAATMDRVPLLDAGRGEVYGTRFDARSTPPAAGTVPFVAAPEAAIAGGPCIVFGNGAVRHEAALRAAGYDGPIGRMPSSIAAGAARIAASLAGPFADRDFTPLYVRPADAELPRR